MEKTNEQQAPLMDQYLVYKAQYKQKFEKQANEAMKAEMQNIKGQMDQAIATDMKKLLRKAINEGKGNARDGSDLPKLCQEMISNLASDNDQEKSAVAILDYSMEVGNVGKYLQKDGFWNIQKLDLSKKNLEQAAQTAAYIGLQTVDEHIIPDIHNNKYDYIVAPITKNNEDLDRDLLDSLIQCLKVGGQIVFAAKQQPSETDEKTIQHFTEQFYWRFVAEEGYSYLNRIPDKYGKFSKTNGKICAFEKLDRKPLLQQKEKDLKQKMEKIASLADKRSKFQGAQSISIIGRIANMGTEQNSPSRFC